MTITNQITLDMSRRGVAPNINAVQGEGTTRLVQITLTSDSVPWNIPSGSTAAVAFLKPDGTRGLYDKLPDGSEALSVSDNVVTAMLAPQVLTCDGKVVASVVFYDDKMNALATFPFNIVVVKNPGFGEQVSNNYYTLQNLDQVNTAYNELLLRIKRLEGDDTLAKWEGGSY